jgi:hypothetical protein
VNIARRQFFRHAFAIVGLTAFTALRPRRAPAETPQTLLKIVSEVVEALSNGDSISFLEKFDHSMRGYSDLREHVEGLVAAYEVGSTVEIANDSGDDQSRTLELDWLLILNERNDLNGQKETRRQIVKCSAERRGRSWKITSLDPIDFFHY